MPAFNFSKQREPLQGQDARPLLQEAPGSVQGSLGCKGRSLEATWQVMRLTADNSREDAGIRLGCRIYVDRHIGYLGHRVVGWRSPRELLLVPGAKRRGRAININSKLAS